MAFTVATCFAAGIVCLSTYLVVVQQRRYGNIHRLKHKYAHLVANPEKMTYTEAHEIHLLMQLYDMPFFTVKAFEFALFQTCELPCS
jgi:hypothetical protein